jgi:hypothetical protein
VDSWTSEVEQVGALLLQLGLNCSQPACRTNTASAAVIGTSQAIATGKLPSSGV